MNDVIQSKIDEEIGKLFTEASAAQKANHSTDPFFFRFRSFAYALQTIRLEAKFSRFRAASEAEYARAISSPIRDRHGNLIPTKDEHGVPMPLQDASGNLYKIVFLETYGYRFSILLDLDETKKLGKLAYFGRSYSKDVSIAEAIRTVVST